MLGSIPAAMHLLTRDFAGTLMRKSFDNAHFQRWQKDLVRVPSDGSGSGICIDVPNN